MKAFERDRLAIDLGAIDTRIYLNEELVLEQRSSIRKRLESGKVAAIGDRCHMMIEIVEPIRTFTLRETPDDLDLIREMLTHFIGQIRPRHLFWKPVVAVAIDLEMSESDREQIRAMMPEIIRSSLRIAMRRNDGRDWTRKGYVRPVR